MHTQPPTLGIDISQRTFDVALWFEQKVCAQAHFDNQAAGFRKLGAWLKRHGFSSLRVGLESTNVYGEALAEWLYAAGHEVHLLNPERTAHYARSLGQRNKTDPADAVTIARFMAQHQGTPWQPPPPEQRQLRSLTRTRAQLVLARKQLASQLRTADATAQPHLQKVLAAITAQLAAIARQVAQHLRTFAPLGERARRLTTLKGVGVVTAAVVLASHAKATPTCAKPSTCLPSSPSVTTPTCAPSPNASPPTANPIALSSVRSPTRCSASS
jgi:transposase